jgi:alkylglycerol monooxygenase
MVEFAKILSKGMPVFLVLVLGEKCYGYWKGKDTVPWMDTLSSFYSGLTFVIRALFGLGISIVSYEFMYTHLALMHLETTGLTYVIAFIMLDFEFYWGHRFHHRINFLWNSHLIHHNSEEYNIATAIRQPFLVFINFLFFLTLPAALIGLSPVVMAFVFPIHKFAQIWYHTQLIGKLGFLEYFIVTPSQHRVHHALNPIYLDKNYSAIFNIWDRIFGTFQEELVTEPPVFGITRPSQSYNPITINMEHLLVLFKDAWRTDKWIEKLTIWFRPTGWRPAGFDKKYPIPKIEDCYNFRKFNPPCSKGLFVWSNIQFFTLAFFVLYFLRNISTFGLSEVLLFAVYVMVQVYSATELMNRHKWAAYFAMVTSVVCIGIYLFDSTWFGTQQFSSLIPFTFLGYFVLQPILAFKYN